MENYLKFVDALKRKIPGSFLVIQLGIAQMAFGECPEGSLYELSFLIYYPILFVLCGVWEGFHAYKQFKTSYPHKSTKDIIAFTILSTFVTLLSFVTLSLFLKDGEPYSCYYEYNKTIVTILFFIVVALTSLITYIEHFYWGKIEYKLPTSLAQGSSLTTKLTQNISM